MRSLINKLLLSLYNPVKVFKIIIDKPDIKDAFIIVLILLITAVISSVTKVHTEHVQQIITYIITIILELLLYMFIVLAFFIEVLYLKIILKIRGTNENIRTIAALLAYTMIPSIIYSSIIAIFPSLLVTIATSGKITILYSKISLGYFLHGYSDHYPIIYNLIKSINIFSIWSKVLEIVAISILGRITYARSLMILMPYWIFSALIPILFLLK